MHEIPTFKVVLVGDAGVGKTTWIRRLKQQAFEPRYMCTRGHEIHAYEWNADESKSARCIFQIWDKAGQEKVSSPEDRARLYEGAHAAIVMVDATAKVTGKSALSWIQDVRTMCSNDLPVVVCWNKIDVEHSLEPFRELVAYCQTHRLTTFHVSCKTNTRVLEPLAYLARVCLHQDTSVVEADHAFALASIQHASIQHTLRTQVLPALETLCAQQRQLEASAILLGPSKVEMFELLTNTVQQLLDQED